MLDALVGAAVIAMATSSLVLAVQVSERAFRDAGCYPITEEEKLILLRISSEDPTRFAETNFQLLPKDAKDSPKSCQDAG